MPEAAINTAANTFLYDFVHFSIFFPPMTILLITFAFSFPLFLKFSHLLVRHLAWLYHKFSTIFIQYQ